MSKIFMHQHDEYGCGHYRAKFPVSHCFDIMSKEGCYLHLDKELQAEEMHFDSYIFHRMPMETLSFFADTLKARGKKIVWEVDDDLHHIPEWMPTEEVGSNIWGFNKVLDLADQVWVSTEPLKTSLGCPDKTTVLPNLIDPNAFMPPPPPRDEAEPIRILWCGGRSHERDLQILIKPLEQLLGEYGHRLQVVFWGFIPTEMLDFYRIPGTMQAMVKPKEEYDGRVWYLEGLPFKFYYDKLSMMRADIALCPLTDCTFNYSKSNLKYLEMSMAGSPVIATRLPPYMCINNGVDGLLVLPDDAEGWYQSIKLLIENPDLRRKLATNAQTKVINGYSWLSDDKYKWAEAFRSLL